MLLELTHEQEFLRDTTARFLDNEVPVSDVRKLRDNPDGFDRSYWRRGAELGCWFVEGRADCKFDDGVEHLTRMLVNALGIEQAHPGPRATKRVKARAGR